MDSLTTIHIGEGDRRQIEVAVINGLPVGVKMGDLTIFVGTLEMSTLELDEAHSIASLIALRWTEVQEGLLQALIARRQSAVTS